MPGFMLGIHVLNPLPYPPPQAGEGWVGALDARDKRGHDYDS